MPSSNSEARKRAERPDTRTTWGTEEKALDNLRAELAACRAEISRLRGENARLHALIPPPAFRRIPRGSGLPLVYSPGSPKPAPMRKTQPD